MKRYALTGGFATGKSTVGRMFEDLGIPRIDADVLVHKLLEPGTEVWNQIVATFGEAILQNDGLIDRPKLADIVFHDPVKRKKLEAIVHPKVRESIDLETKKLSDAGHEKILVEIPLLFEAGWNKEKKWDAILVVTADEKTQLERAVKKFGLSAEAVQARIAAQLPLAEKEKKATFVIDNGKDQAHTQAQVEAILKKL